MNSEKRYFVDRIIIVAAVVEPMFVIPQVISVFSGRDAAGVSILTWLGLSVLTGVWVWYAYVHKERMVLLYQSLFLVCNVLVIIGAALNGAKWL